MQKLKLLLPLALFLGAMFFVACHEDDRLTESDKMAKVAFAGRIIDENGDPVSGATVKAGTLSVATDQNGVFRLAEVSLSANHAVLSVTGTGYFDFSRAYVVQDHALQYVTVQLLSKKLAGTLNAASGGVVNVAGGPKITFPANAIADENGNPYTGTVQVVAQYLDPKSPTLGLFMPGNLTGLNLAGERQALSTYGMMAVELQGSFGQKLKIAANAEVEMRVPIDASIVSGAPAEIPLWHYDLDKGYWIEEGSAQKVGNEYVGKVKHFSYWNYDGNLPSVIVNGKVYLNDLDHPLAGVQVTISPANPVNGWGCGHGNTDGNGCYGGSVTKDEVLNLEVSLWDPICGYVVLYQSQVGPFSADATLPPIIVTMPTTQSVSVSGRLLDCNGQPIVNGYAKVTFGSSNNFAYADANGNFTINQILCSTLPNTGQVTGYDFGNLLESDPVAFILPPNTVNVGDVTVCNTLSEYVRYTLDGGQEIVNVVPTGGWDAGLTFITTLDSIQTTFTQFSFMNNGQTGNFPLSSLIANQVTFDPQGANTLNTTVSASGTNIGDLIIGSFGGNFLDYNGTGHTITGSYKVKRSW